MLDTELIDSCWKYSMFVVLRKSRVAKIPQSLSIWCFLRVSTCRSGREGLLLEKSMPNPPPPKLLLCPSPFFLFFLSTSLLVPGILSITVWLLYLCKAWLTDTQKYLKQLNYLEIPLKYCTFPYNNILFALVTTYLLYCKPWFADV